MEDEIRKAVEAGKLSTNAGDQLAKLMPGTYCQHKSWGFGQIDALNFLLNQVTIHFKAKRGHTMQLAYAAESLTPLAEDHILVRKSTALDAVKKLASGDPEALLRIILQSYDGKATVDQIATCLAPEVFNETAFKKWWESTKKIVKSQGHFNVPSKKNEPVILRDAPVERSAELLEAFQSARQLKDQIAAFEGILKNTDAFSDKQVLAPIIAKAESAAQQGQKLHAPEAFTLLSLRDDLCAKTGLAAGAPDLATMAREEYRSLPEIFERVNAGRIKTIFASFPKAFGDDWQHKAIQLLPKGPAKLISEVARLFADNKKSDELHHALHKMIRDHSVTTDMLIWLCKEREGTFSGLVNPEFFSAVISSLERDLLSEKRTSRLQDLLFEDRDLVTDILDGADFAAVRDAMRKLLMTPVFEELSKRSLIGRIVRIYPEVESLITGGESEKVENLIVSWGSLHKRKEDYEDLVNKKIPQNTQDIAIARSYGDLRENFEFKSAKEQQRVLMRRKSETERDLSRARGTDFANPDLTQAGIGTTVRLHSATTGVSTTYTILGAWDTEPDRGIISYLSAMAVAIVGHKAGETIEIPTETGTELVELLAIETPSQDLLPEAPQS